jgi:hypothetical protein
MNVLEQARNLFYENISLKKYCINDNSIIYLPEIKNVPQCIKDVRKKIIDQNNFHNKFNNPELHDFILEIKGGNYLSPHTDFLGCLEEGTYTHIRANWVAQAPVNDVYIFANEGDCFKIKENEVYLVDSNKHHNVSKVLGETPLIIYSFGFIERKSNV